MTLREIALATQGEGVSLSAEVDCQVTRVRPNVTKAGKPFLDLEVSDGTATEKFKIWEDSEAYPTAVQVQEGDGVHLEGSFWRNNYGLNIDRLRLRWLKEEQLAALLAGSPAQVAILDAAWSELQNAIATVQDGRLRLLAQTFLTEHEEKFRRAAAAREYHHARRGGLLEHTAQMMRCAIALAPVYPTLNWDLLRVGIVFHDAGKLWELDYAAKGFGIPYTTRGELLGHITIGVELINRLWRALETNPEMATPGQPPRELVREHLLHLVAAHHGMKDYGSPVTPRTPEAWMLHQIDNMDAWQEMMAQTYAEKAQIGPGIFEHRRPLEGRMVAPLPLWMGEMTPPPESV